MSTASEFSPPQIARVREQLRERYHEEIDIHLADCEVALDSANPETLESYPAIFWYARSANFVIFKLGEDRFRGQFFYTPDEHFGTGQEEYRALDECVATVLKAQSDHERDREGERHGDAGADRNPSSAT